jgi:hypothetical protein
MLVAAAAALALAMALAGPSGAVAAAQAPAAVEATSYKGVGNERVIVLIPDEIFPSHEIHLLLLSTATESLCYVEGFFGRAIPHPVVYMWSNVSYDRDSPVEPSGAYAISSCIVIDHSANAPQTPAEVEKLVYLMVHEYTHLVHSLYVHGTYNSISEGFATLVSSLTLKDARPDGLPEAGEEDQWVLPEHIFAASSLRAGILPPIREILTTTRSHAIPDWSTWIVYRLSTSLLGFIDQWLGRPTLTDIFRHSPEISFHVHDDPFHTFEGYTGIPLDELESEWHNYLMALEVSDRSVAAVKLLKDMDKIGMESLLWVLRREGKKLDPEFVNSLLELQRDILKYGQSPLYTSDEKAEPDLTEESLAKRLDVLVEWSRELWRKAYEQ